MKSESANGRLMVSALALFLGACVHWPPVLNISAAPIQTSKSVVTEREVKETIRSAAVQSGWSVTDDGQWRFVATKMEKKRSASVYIDYYLNTYSIRYRDSLNLDHHRRPMADRAGTITNSENAVIDEKYNDWVRQLDQAIQKAFSALE
jgi:hypothetical protein